MLNNNPCTSVEASVGGGANLDTLESVVRVMKAMQERGYSLENIPESGDALIKTIMGRKALSDFRWTTTGEIVNKGGTLDLVSKELYESWFAELPKDLRASIIENWGEPVGEGMVHDGKLLVTGVQFGNTIVCAQPKRGCMGSKCDGSSCKILHDPHIPPTHQYLATYRWFERVFGADVLIHVGTHGNLEFLPGKSVAQSDSCCTDACLGDLPLLYIYNADNPPEATIAKRRAMAVTVDHMQTIMVSGGLYDNLEELDNLLTQYEKTKIADASQAHLMEHLIYDEIQKSELLSFIDLNDYHSRMDEIAEQCHKVLSTVKNTQIQDGMHIFGQIPEGEQLVDMIASILRFEGVESQSIRSHVCEMIGLCLPIILTRQGHFYSAYGMTGGEIVAELDRVSRNIIKLFLNGENFCGQSEAMGRLKVKFTLKFEEINAFRPRVEDIAKRIADSKEIDSLLTGMDGDFIPAGPAGIVTRGRDDVLPTGRNMYSLDPEMVPTKAAWEVGRRLGNAVIEKFQKEENRYPDNMALYWMTTDIMWADGEGMAQLLYMLGVEPVWLPNGKVRSFRIIPLSELGRPRIDVTVKISGILRDNFQNCINLVDDAIHAVAALNEPEDSSRRVTAGLRQKQKAGLVITPPFGYFKDKNTKQVVIVPEAAETIHLIFSSYLDGKGVKAIAVMLNENGNKTPALMQKHLTGKRLPEKQELIIKKYLWDATMVSRILQDESYTGTLICHKSERNKINKTNRATSPDEQFRHENFLPSIIPRDLWEQVQELMAMRKRESVRAGEGRPILRYSGLIACGDCGRTFTGKRVKQKNGERVEYICSTYLRYGKQHCSAHPIREEYLDDIVRQELQNTKQQYQSLWTQLEKAIEGWLPKTTNTQQQLRKQRERIELLEEEVETILMERIRDKENAQRYDRMIAKREEQIANAKKRIEELENIGQIIRSRQAKLRKDIGLIDDILADGKISEAHLRMLIERIYVYETEGGLSLEIKVKAPFQNHTDSYENGVLTNSEIEELIGVS